MNTHDVIIMSQYSVEVVAHGQVVWFGCQIWHNVYYFMYIMYIIVYTTQSVYTTLYTSAVPIQTYTCGLNKEDKNMVLAMEIHSITL